MGSPVEELRMGLLLGPPHGHRLPVDHLGDPGGRLVHVADHDGLGGADHHAGRLEPDVQAVSAEVALLGRVIFGVDEDGVVGAGGDAGLASDADGLVEIDDAVRPLVHGLGRAGGDTGWIFTLVAAGNLKGPAGFCGKVPTSTYLT